ncbi:hypothetical protein C8J56DRAFT_1004560 [Mycena floridula]|nr:hypothetical protein C8J56DRAFT_1004560 [Mycena floridula]
MKGEPRWVPFVDKEEWELGSWLAKSIGQTSTDGFLKLPIIQKRCKLSYHNNYSFQKKLDQLLIAPEWKCEMVDVRGIPPGKKDPVVLEKVELWKRDPLKVIRELVGNPAFKDHMAYAPERAYTSGNLDSRMYDEMWTANWWWDLQEKLPVGTTIVSVILSSDKTQLSVFSGDKSAWPVYPTAHATILAGYLLVSKMEYFESGDARREASHALFHKCMRRLLKPLVKAGTEGVDMVCGADAFIRSAAYVADFLEQCLITCATSSRCPRCTVPFHDRGDNAEWALRRVDETLAALEEQRRSGKSKKFERDGIQPVFEPLWKDLPHADIFSCITPDIFHQLHKGVFKEHLVKWCIELIGEEELDARFKAMSGYPGLRHFKNGITSVTQWTGQEHKEMQRVFVGLLAGTVSNKVLIVVKALVDFIFYAEFQSHTNHTLAALDQCLKTFHDHKDLFIELGIRENFNIPKFHTLIHCISAIRNLGSADGYNTESPERLHINYAKRGYRASNKHDYTEQMTIWLQRQEAIARHQAYFGWLDEELENRALFSKFQD